MPRKKGLQTKSTITAKPAAKASSRPSKSSAKPKPRASAPAAKKAVPKLQTSSLVYAKPMAAVAPSVSPKNPEQMLYEPDTIKKDQAVPVEPAAAKKIDAPATEAASKKRTVTASTKADKPRPAAPSQPKAAVSVSSIEMPRLQAISSPPSAVKLQRRRQIRRSLLALGMIALIVLVGVIWRVQHAPDIAGANSKLIAEVSKRAVLPKGETPSVTTVVDESKLNQEFLRNAKKGDKVLLYFQSSQAVVYRPSTGQIVNMGPLQTPRPRVFIRQGSNADNVAAVRAVIGRTSDFLLASQDQSPKKDYSKTIVIDLTGNRPDLAGQLAQLLHVNVGPLPEGETPPDADLMVLVGSDFK